MPTAVRQRIAGAATPYVAALLSGAPRDVTVVAASPQAIYADLGGRCIAVLAAHAVAVPCGIRTRQPTLPALRCLRIGDARCVVGDLEITVRRLVDAGLPRFIPPEESRLDRAALVSAVDAELEPSTLEDLAAGDPSAVCALLGRGSGLTPLGDDVLAGWLVARVATGQPRADVAAAVERWAGERTTLISATLLAHASRGESIPQVRALLAALHRGAGVDARLRELLAVGHTSGTGLALGVALGLAPARARLGAAR